MSTTWNPYEQDFIKDMNAQQREAMEFSYAISAQKLPILIKDEHGTLDWEKAIRYRNGKRIIHQCPYVCHTGVFKDKQCPNAAGLRTQHEGVGVCQAHGGNKRKGRALSAWILMHAMAQQLNVSPWDALLSQIRLLSGQVAWLTQKLGNDTKDDDDLRPDGDSFYWMELLENRGKRLAVVSKMAIDAGIAERMITLMEDQAQVLHQSVQRAAIEINLDEKTQYELLTKVAMNFQAIESGKEPIRT